MTQDDHGTITVEHRDDGLLRMEFDLSERWGLINRAVPESEFEPTVEKFLSDLIDGPPVALRKAKRVMNESRDGALSVCLEMESQAFGLLLSTDDAREGTTAFIEKRNPAFEGK